MLSRARYLFARALARCFTWSWQYRLSAWLHTKVWYWIPCRLVGHEIPVVSKGSVGFCVKCENFYHIGKRGRVLGKIVPQEMGGKVPRALTRQMRRGMVPNA